VGAGSAGLTVAAAAASLGQDVVLVEKGKMGGDCLNYGCVPSKSLIAAAKHAHMARDGARFGVHAEPRIDYGAVHAHVHAAIAAIAPHDSVERFESLGVTVLRTHARFVDERTVEAGDTLIRARRFVVAAGSSPAIPPIEGLSDCAPLTNETVFDLTERPDRLAIIGGGPIGSELAQAFARLGSEVTVIEANTMLSKEDPEAAAVVRAALARDGVVIHENVSVSHCRRDGEENVIALDDGQAVRADRLLVATGRRPNLGELGLDAAGISYTKAGITVDKRLRTTNRRVFAIGDVTGGLQFTHVAGYQASLAVRAIVFRLPVSYDPDLMPRATYTAPELAQVGLTEAEAKARDSRATAFTSPFTDNDRAQAEGETGGFAKLVLDGRGRLAGATIVAPNAGELIATYALALAAKAKLSTIASFVAAYPTFAEAGKHAAVAHFAQKLDKPWLRTVLRGLRRL
jgi:pyruvate/2-oxoglutarate dehydrogenase complex dihydrolipoamide dehydrogenase (E3) component